MLLKRLSPLEVEVYEVVDLLHDASLEQIAAYTGRLHGSVRRAARKLTTRGYLEFASYEPTPRTPHGGPPRVRLQVARARRLNTAQGDLHAP